MTKIRNSRTTGIKKTFDELRARLGEEHVDTREVWLTYIDALIRDGDTEHALTELALLISVSERMLGDNHIFVAGLISKYAHYLMQRGKYQDAYTKFHHAAQLTYHHYGPTSEEWLYLRGKTAECITYLGKYEEAGQIFSELLTTRRRLYGNDHPGILGTWINYLVCLEKQRDYPKALAEAELLLPFCTKLLGNHHNSTLYVRSKYAAILRGIGKPGIDRNPPPPHSQA